MRVREEQKRVKRYKIQDKQKAQYKPKEINLTVTTLTPLGRTSKDKDYLPGINNKFQFFAVRNRQSKT